MTRLVALLMSATFLVLSPSISRAELKDENILLPVPSSFKVGTDQTQGKLKILELVPADQTVDNWTTMVTEQVRYGLALTDPDRLPTIMLEGWSQGCPGGRDRG